MTVIVNVATALASMPPFAVPPLSCSCTLTTAEPNVPGAGVNVSVPAGDTAGATAKSVGFVLLVVKVSVWPASFAGPALIAVAQPPTVAAPESSATVWSAPFAKPGASFTAETVITNVCGALVSTPPPEMPPSSCSCTVTVADPFAFAAGVNVSVPSAATAGCALKSAPLVVETMKFSVCADSPAPPPALIAVAQLATVCAPASSMTD